MPKKLKTEKILSVYVRAQLLEFLLLF